MTVYIVSTFFRGHKMAAMLKPVNGKLQVVDIGGYPPSSFPKSIAASALKKMTPNKCAEIPVVSHRHGPDFNLRNFDSHEFDLSDLTL